MSSDDPFEGKCFICNLIGGGGGCSTFQEWAKWIDNRSIEWTGWLSKSSWLEEIKMMSRLGGPWRPELRSACSNGLCTSRESFPPHFGYIFILLALTHFIGSIRYFDDSINKYRPESEKWPNELRSKVVIDDTEKLILRSTLIYSPLVYQFMDRDSMNLSCTVTIKPPNSPPLRYLSDQPRFSWK